MAKPVSRLLFSALQVAIGGLFIYAAAVKIWDFKASDWATQQFAQDVQNYQLLSRSISFLGYHVTPMTLSILTAVYLPWLELLSGTALVFHRLQSGALAILTALTFFFLIALSSAWARGLDISCGCFGKEHNATNFPLHVGGDLILLVALLILGYREFSAPARSPGAAPAS